MRHYPSCARASRALQHGSCVRPRPCLLVQRWEPCSERNQASFSSIVAPSAKLAPMLPASLDSLGLKYLENDELRKRFDEFDLNNDGEIDRDEAREILMQAGAEDASPQAAAKLVSDLDSSNSKTVTWEEFQAAVDRSAEPVDKRIYPISFSLGLHFTGLGVQAPCLPIMARGLGLSHSDLGIVMAAGALARISMNIPLVILVERFGRRPLLVLGPGMGAMAMTGMGLSNSFAGLTVFSAAGGVAGATIMTAAGLYLSDISTPRNRARTTAPLMLTALLGFSVGPAIGGLLAESHGLQAPFFVCAGGMAFASLSAFAMLPETHRSAGQAAKNNNSLHQWLQLLKRPALQGIVANVLMTGIVQGAAPVTTVLFASEMLGMSTQMVGLMFTANVVGMGLCTPVAARLSDWAAKKNKRLNVMMPGVMIGASMLALQSVCTSTELFITCGVLGAMGNAFVMPNVSAFIMDHTFVEERPHALALQRISQDVGLLLGASTMGFVAASAGVPLAMQASAAMQALGAMFCFARGRGPPCKRA